MVYTRRRQGVFSKTELRCLLDKPLEPDPAYTGVGMGHTIVMCTSYSLLLPDLKIFI